jgi:hypothetical protein
MWKFLFVKYCSSDRLAVHDIAKEQPGSTITVEVFAEQVGTIVDYLAREDRQGGRRDPAMLRGQCGGDREADPPVSLNSLVLLGQCSVHQR